ncbi:methionine--tRNA ligase [Candidatus Pacearchaeota archaeon]|nr:methionine--tRNA ligase [Candidatus Pacearchaeota archaeon]
MTDTYYVTTPIYYPNDVPHIGHAYTTLAGDVLARWHKLQGKEVFFLTGTDEHGKKIEEAAKKAKLSPKTFTDHLVPKFKEAWKKLNIHPDRFIRTTDTDHEQVVQVILSEVHKKGDIYEGHYEGYYCTACEAYYTEKDLVDGCCPIHKTKIEKLKEESYFFKLSKYQKLLLAHYKKNPDFISPDHRRQEIINRVKEGLQDLSISRTSFSWGIPLPFDKDHITYVWFDALVNYLSGIGYLENTQRFKKFWPANVHLIGKDILWFHAVIWPAILLSADIPLPKKIFAHGWWTFNNEKISKSRGKVINVDDLINIAGADSARYFLIRETPFGEDGDFSEDALIERHNNELANKLGNLVSRVSTLAEIYGLEKTTSTLSKKLKIKEIEKHMESLALDKALTEIFSFIDASNEYIQAKKPWETKDKKVLYELVNAIKDIAILLSPFVPETAEKIAKTFHATISWESLQKPISPVKIKKASILFNKVKKDG